jgi:hypothetical protein
MRLASLNTVLNNDAINAENNGDLPPKSRLSRKGVHALISSLTFRLANYAPVRL